MKKLFEDLIKIVLEGEKVNNDVVNRSEIFSMLKSVNSELSSLYDTKDALYDDLEEVKSEIDSLYSHWNNAGFRTIHGDNNQSNRMYSLKDKRRAIYEDINDMKIKIKNLKNEKYDLKSKLN